MQVFKLFFRIIRKNTLASLLYFGVFILLAVFASGSWERNTDNQFESSSAKIAIVNNDRESDVIRGLQTVLEQNNQIVSLENNQEKIQDALFFRAVEYIVTIPQGFSDALEQGNLIPIERTTIPDSTTRIYVDMVINKYCNNMRLYSQFLNEPTGSYSSLAVQDLTEQTLVSISESAEQTAVKEGVDYYFNYASYILIIVTLYCMASFIMKFNNPVVRKRNYASPMKTSSMNAQVILASVMTTFFIWLVIVVIAMCLYGASFFTLKGLWHSVNALVYSFTCLSFAFLIGNIIQKDSVLSGVVNTVSLMFAFLGGAFVPQEVMSDVVNQIGSFTPSYWYVKSSDRIAALSDASTQSLFPILSNMLIVAGFAVVLFAIGLVVTKQKRITR